ncbi:hypothetical protein ACOMHN_021625 [Nucella lapillus]
MMKVYQPVCPDMKFRLVADLSPDSGDVSEDSTVSSDSASVLSDDEDVKMKVPQLEETPATNPLPHPPHFPRFPPGSASAISSATGMCHQHDTSTASTEAACLMSELSSASAQPLSGAYAVEESHGSGTDCVDNCQGRAYHQSQCVTAGAKPSAPQKDSTVKFSTPAQSHDDENVSSANTHHMNGTAVSSASSCSMQKPVCVYEKICNSINPYPQVVHETDKDDCMCGDDDKEEDSDDDNASVEDISISHNVPMCPPSPAPFSPARTPPMTRRAMVTAKREVQGLSCSSSRGGRREQIRSSRLHLDVNTPSKKHGSPYTLACAITPSPLHEQTTLASTLTSASKDAPPADPLPAQQSTSDNKADHMVEKQPPTQLPDSPGCQKGEEDPMNRSIYDEIQEALIKEVSGGDDTLQEPPLTCDTADPAQQYPFIHKHMGHLFDKKRLLIGYASTIQPVRHSRDVSTSPCRSGYSSSGRRSRHVSAASTASEAASTTCVEEAVYVNKMEDRPGSDGEEEVIRVSLVDDEPDGAASGRVMYGQKRRRKNSDGDGSRRHSSSTMATPYSDLEVTHRGMHRFIPRHADEVQIGIGDPIHVVKEFDDLWCEGVNLRSGERGIFPAMYANDLTFLEESGDEDEHWKFTMRFLGTVEVTSASGDVALCQAINKVAQQDRIKAASLCILEINQYGIRMIDKSKEGHESHKFSFFFALKNISFCGTHPNNNRYFAFITKHPHEARFACHVFHSERSTHRARDALGKAFKRFYQEYMAFTHPTEDIWIE